MRETSIYRTSLMHAWQLTWRHKELWILGILAVFLGQFGLGDFIGNILQQTEKFVWPGLNFQMPVLTLKMVVCIIWAGLIIVGLSLLILISSVISQGALISATAEWYKKGKISPLSKLWKDGVANFWHTLIINIGRRLLLLLLAVLFGYFWIKIGMKGGWTNTLLMILILAVELFAAMMISAISIYALGYKEIDKKGIFSSLTKAFKLFFHHLVVSLELNLILFFISLILIVIIFPIPTIFLVPSMVIWSVAGVTGYTYLLSFGLILSWFMFLATVALIGGIFNAFATSAWIYVFMIMHHEGLFSRILHHIKNIFRR